MAAISIQKADGCLDPAHAQQHRVHRAVIREQGEEQHCEGRGHDQVGHVDDRLEEGLSLQLQSQVGEPCRQQQRDDDLRDETDDPEDQRVAEILGQIGREQGDVVFQTHKVGSDDLQTAAVILKKAVIDGGCQRDQLEYREDDKERCNEDIAPFRVADRPFLLCFFSHEISLLPGHSKTKGAGEIRRPPLCFNFQFGVKPLMRAIPRRSARGTSP